MARDGLNQGRVRMTEQMDTARKLRKYYESTFFCRVGGVLLTLLVAPALISYTDGSRPMWADLWVVVFSPVLILMSTLALLTYTTLRHLRLTKSKGALIELSIGTVLFVYWVSLAVTGSAPLALFACSYLPFYGVRLVGAHVRKTEFELGDREIILVTGAGAPD